MSWKVFIALQWTEWPIDHALDIASDILLPATLELLVFLRLLEYIRVEFCNGPEIALSLR